MDAKTKCIVFGLVGVAIGFGIAKVLEHRKAKAVGAGAAPADTTKK